MGFRRRRAGMQTGHRIRPQFFPGASDLFALPDGRGRFDEAIAEIKTAIDLEPTSLFNQRNYGNSLYYARRYEEAVLQFKRVIEMDPNFVTTYVWLVRIGNAGKSCRSI